MIDPDFAYKVIGFIMSSSVSALISGLLIGGFFGACITKLLTEIKDSSSADGSEN